jgi:epoxyqueuosine reductase
VRGAAIWALGQLLPAEEFEELSRTKIVEESDESVRGEWKAVMPRESGIQ